jgi:hypothetical protein
MSRPRGDPLAGTDRLVVDATNLLRALGRGLPSLPPAAVVGRLRAVIPATASVELVFDGPPEPGMRRTRVAAGVVVQYSAPATADGAILSMLERMDVAARAGVLVISDDTELRAMAERLGARSARNRWLIGRLERGVLAAPSVGNRRAAGAGTGAMAPGPGGRGVTAARLSDATPPRSGDPASAELEERRWSPGRRATVKRGNPRRGRRTSS